MAANNAKLNNALKSPFDTPVYYFAGYDETLLRQAANAVLKALDAAGADGETTRIDGPTPDIGEIIAAAGAISFFGTPRVVYIREASPSAIKDKDADELVEIFGQLENAVLVVTALYKDKRTASSKKAKAIFAAAEKSGVAMEVTPPTRRENLDFINQTAHGLGAAFAPGAAEALLERAGEERALLKSETEKLAAFSGYGEITHELVAKYATHNVEADVFELARLITAGRRSAAQKKLADLLALKHEPIAIAAALSGTYVDMYRVRAGEKARRATSAIFKEMGYKGNDYRLKKAGENARRYSTRQLEAAVILLAGLDRELKSSALPDKSILLEAAVSQLIIIGEK